MPLPCYITRVASDSLRAELQAHRAARRAPAAAAHSSTLPGHDCSPSPPIPCLPPHPISFSLCPPSLERKRLVLGPLRRDFLAGGTRHDFHVRAGAWSFSARASALLSPASHLPRACTCVPSSLVPESRGNLQQLWGDAGYAPAQGFRV